MKIANLVVTKNSFTTAIATNPTANRTITLPDTTGTVALVSDLAALVRMWTEVVTGGTTVALSRTPDTTRPISLFVNGQRYTREQGDISISGSTITWLPVAAGFSLDSTDAVLAEYWA